MLQKADDTATAAEEKIKMSFLLTYVNQESVKYGLYNQGATCYLNSVLQVLYMTEDFRAAVERCVNYNYTRQKVCRGFLSNDFLF